MIENKVELCGNSFSTKNKLYRLVWLGVFWVFFRWTPVPLFFLRNFILRLFGADVSYLARVYPSAKIWMPSNLKVGPSSTIGPNVNIYNQGFIKIGDRVIVSQGAYLCASTHDYNNPLHPLVLAPIVIEDKVWICADAFVGPYVVVAEGGVVGARAVVVKNTQPWRVYAGNPSIEVNIRDRFQ